MGTLINVQLSRTDALLCAAFNAIHEEADYLKLDAEACDDLDQQTILDLSVVAVRLAARRHAQRSLICKMDGTEGYFNKGRPFAGGDALPLETAEQDILTARLSL